MNGGPMLFPSDMIPEVATPVSETSQEWMDAQLLRSVEGIRFNEARCADYIASLQSTVPGSNPLGFLDFIIERLGGRSQ